MKSTLKLEIRAGKASLQPPIGPRLGQFGIPGAKFCQDFNDQTKIYDENIILSVKIQLFKKKINSISWSPNISKILQRLYYNQPIILNKIFNFSKIKENKKITSSLIRNQIIKNSNILKLKLLIKKKLRKKKKKQQFLLYNYIYIEDIYILRMRLNPSNLKNKIKELLRRLNSMQIYILRR